MFVATQPAGAQPTATPPYTAPTTAAVAEPDRYDASPSVKDSQPARPKETTLPDWQDGQSVYLSMNQRASERKEQSGTPLPDQPTAAIPPVDTAAPPVVQASFNAPASQMETAADVSMPKQPVAAPAQDPRCLAPPSVKDGRSPASNGQTTSASKLISNIGLPSNSIYSTLSALVIVVGLFLVCMWVLRRAGRKSNKLLPAEVVSVLGRVPLAGRQFAELLRVGNKLVLVALMPTGAETLTEVTDPLEVDRLAGLCQQHDPHSSSLAFEDVFTKMSHEPAADGFLGHDEGLGGMTSAAAYRMQRGGARG